MNNYDSKRHVRGESLFLDDFNIPKGTLFAAVFSSSIAHGKIIKLDLSDAEKSEGVIKIFTAKDIPGENQIGGIVPDEKLLADDTVEFIGEPIAFVVATSNSLAKKALKKIKIEFEKFDVITNPKVAFQKGSLILPNPKIYECGNINDIWAKCDVIVEDTVESGGQEHLYLETQAALSIPLEGNSLKIISSTQNPTAIQRTAAKVLNISNNKIESEVLRLGGGFGGKEDQATAWAVMTALAAYKLNRPVKLVLSRQDDVKMTGKRHPYISDYKIGLSSEGKILAYEVTYYQNSGAAADLSPAILDRTLAHCTNSYFIPNVKATGYCCKTNLPPNTAFRGFGGPQGMFVIESAIYKAAEKMNINPVIIQEKNLLKEGDEFTFGQKTESCNAEKTWKRLFEKYNLEEIQKSVSDFNSQFKYKKKGFAIMPICFGISFTNTMLNQASSLVHIYGDGSVGITTGAVEMGQGVNMKIRQIASAIFGIDISKIKSEATNTTRNANTSATAASSGADLNGNATAIACNEILIRLKNYLSEVLKCKSEEIEIKNEKVFLSEKETEYNWEKLISEAYRNRINLSSHSFYKTPEIFFDPKTNKGKPFAYHVYGTAIISVEIDCIRGTYVIESVKVVHDFGKSINPIIDLSQAEGALIQGIGWMTLEEIIYNQDGKLLTDALSTYKVPDINFTPEVEIEFLKDSFNKFGPMNSKAIGEPPFMYGIAVYFALLNAIKEFRKNKEFKIIAPMTPERVLTNLYD